MLGANIFDFCFLYRHIRNRIWKSSYKMPGKPSLSRREYFRNYWKCYPQISTKKFKSTTIETFSSDRSYYVTWYVGYLKFWRPRFSRYVAQHSTVTSSITPFLTWYFQDWPTEKDILAASKETNLNKYTFWYASLKSVRPYISGTLKCLACHRDGFIIH